MTHPYKQHKEVHPGRSRVKKLFKVGGGVHSDAVEDAAMIRKAIGEHDKQLHKGKHTDLKSLGNSSKDRMDKYARGGKVKHGKGKGHHTKINIIVAPKGNEGADAPPPAPPLGAMAPKPPMGPPPIPAGGPPPGGPPMPGMMNRGGKAIGGLATKENLKKWSDRASANTRYERGGKVHMTAGADSGEGRLQKAKAYGRKAKKA